MAAKFVAEFILEELTHKLDIYHSMMDDYDESINGDRIAYECGVSRATVQMIEDVVKRWRKKL